MAFIESFSFRKQFYKNLDFYYTERYNDIIKKLGINALYLGPLFESTAHGYDTADYFHADRRLGNSETLVNLSAGLHANGIRLVLDRDLDHVRRDFWAFRDVQRHELEL